MVKPTFICIGVQKSGTHSLINYLSSHPDIYMERYEIHFFDNPQNNITNKEISEYEQIFQTDKLIIGEKTPSYSYLQFAMDRIYNYNPNIKLILILREPISRAFSQYNMNLNLIGKTLDDVNEQQIHSDFEKEELIKLSELTQSGNYFIIRGLYDEIIEYILSKFSQNNLYIGISEEIKKDKLNEYNKIIKFLGGNVLNGINGIMDGNIGEYKKNIPKSLEQKLYNIYKPHNEKLYKILGRKIDIWEEYYDKIKSAF